jgi:Lon protease-like protein
MFEHWLTAPQSDDEPDFVPLFSLEEEDEPKEDEIFPDSLPILPLKNTVLFPGIVTPITIGRDKSIRAVQKAYEDNRLIGVLSQKDVKIESPSARDLYQTGTVARILKLLKMPDGSTTAILQGRKRFHLESMVSEDPYMLGNIRTLENAVERAVLLCEGPVIRPDDLPPKLRRVTQQPRSTLRPLPDSGIDLRLAVQEYENDMIRQALDRTRGNKNRAAQLLGLNRTTLVEMLKRKRL